MKIILSVIMIVTSLLAPSVHAAPLKVVTTLPVLAFITKELAGDRASVDSLTNPDQDPHFVQPKPTLMKKVRDADMFIEIGLELELWAQKVIDGSGNLKVQRGQPGRVIASSGVSLLDIPQVLSRELGDVHPYGNPHIWLDPLNVSVMANNIADALGKIDSAGKEQYQTLLVAFQDRLARALFGDDLVKIVGAKKLGRLAQQDLLDAFLKEKKLDDKLGGWLKKSRNLANKRVITYHRTWPYFAKRFGLVIPIEIEEKPGISPSPKHRDLVIDTAKKMNVKIIALEPFYDRTAADYIAKRVVGAKVVQVPIDVGSLSVNSYFQLIDTLLERLSN